VDSAQPPKIAYHDILNTIAKNSMMTPKEIICIVRAITQKSKLKKIYHEKRISCYIKSINLI
jgi:hypothetical protein